MSTFKVSLLIDATDPDLATDEGLLIAFLGRLAMEKTVRCRILDISRRHATPPPQPAPISKDDAAFASALMETHVGISPPRQLRSVDAGQGWSCDDLKEDS